MNILNISAFIFEADVSGLQSGIDDANKKIDELKEKLEQVGDEANSSAVNYLEFFGAVQDVVLGGKFGKEEIISISKAFLSLCVDVAEANSALGNLADKMNINVNTFDAWRKAIIHSGGDVDSFTKTMKNLSERFSDPEQALLRFSSALDGMSSVKAQNVGKMLGLDEGTIELLRQGKKNVQELILKYKQHGAVTQEQVETSNEFNKQLAISNSNISSLVNSVVMLFIPALTLMLQMFNGLSDWVIDNGDGILDFLLVLAALLTTVYLPAIITSTAATFAAAVAWLAATWPIILIGAAITALALIISDIIGYFKGFNSVTGDLVNTFPLLGTVLNGVKDTLVALGDIFVKAFTDPIGAIEDLVNLIDSALIGICKGFLELIFGEETANSIFDFINDSIDVVIGSFKYLKSIFDSVFSFIMKGIEGLKSGVSKIAGFLGFGNEEESQEAKIAEDKKNSQDTKLGKDSGARIDATFGGSEYLVEATSTPLASMTSNSINQSSLQQNKSSNININKIELVTQATNSEEIAQSFSDQLRDALWQFNDGCAI